MKLHESDQALSPAVRAQIEAAGGWPDPFDSLEQWRRARHDDLAAMDDERLAAERIQVAVVKSLLIVNECWDGAKWWSARLARIGTEIARRKRRALP